MDNDEIAKKEQAASAWGRAATTYSQVGPHFFQHFGERLVEIAPISEGGRVLDVAAGRGAVLFPASAKVGPDGEVVGIDYSEGMARETSAQIEVLGIQNARMLQMDAEMLEFEDASFDCVLCGFALFFFPHLDKALSEFRRVLKPGGVLAVSTWGPGDDRWKWLDELADGARPQYDKERPQFDKPEGMRALLGEAGFANVEVSQEEAEFFYADEEEWWATQWSHGARLLLERLPPEALERARPIAHQKLQEMKQPEGIPMLFRALYSVAGRD